VCWILRVRFRLAFSLVLLLAAAAPVRAQDRLCDPGNEDCRAILINYIRNETVAIDVAFWFMEDARYTNELILRWRAGVSVRVLIDPRANSDYPLNAERLAELQAAGIPMRKRLTSNILHWKMMLFHAQNVVEFSGANYSADAWRPTSATPYENYVDEAIYFTSDTAIVNSFRTKFDDQWIDTAGWANYANVTGSLVRQYGIFSKDPSLNFPPEENYRTRAVKAYDAERRAIDVMMYRITDRAHADKMLAAVSRGIPVRLITEPEQYRDPSRMWHAWNVDRLYMGGVLIRQRGHQGLNHQKSVILYDQDPNLPGDQSMVIFGSSNWTSPSASGQLEHNMFTTKPGMTSWFISQFERKWNNSSGVLENVDFTPLPPDPPASPNPAVGAANVATKPTLSWAGGPWAHFYDLYLDTSPDPTTLIAANLAESSAKTATSRFSFTVPFTLRTATRYYWRVVGRTMATQVRSSPVWTFTTGGARACPGEYADFDGDCRADVAVFRPSNGSWYQRFSRTGTGAAIQWGASGDIPVPGDYDGDGRKDVAVYRPSNGVWYVLQTSNGRGFSVQWGNPGDQPVPGDYDGDGRTDIAVFRAGTGVWYVRYTATGRGTAVPWGAPGDVPVPGNYDSDRKTDFVVFRPGVAVWYAWLSSTGVTSAAQWGVDGDIPVPGDYDGDGQTDRAVYRPSTASWYARFSSAGSGGDWQWGTPGDRPVPGDYDGDGRTDVAVFRPATGMWYIRYSSSGTGGAVQWGVATDVAVLQPR
jgi:phosphatidylserine/phosphatidylglycerophosphate/cardiolipin synthase-like enzyme